MAHSTLIATGSNGTLAQTATGFATNFGAAEVVSDLKLQILADATGSAAKFIISGVKEPEFTKFGNQGIQTGQHATLATALGSISIGANQVCDAVAVTATQNVDGTSAIHYVVALVRSLY